MPLTGIPSNWESGSRIAIIRDALRPGTHHEPGTESGKSKCAECRRAAGTLYDAIGAEPFVYSSKVNGVMTPLPKGAERWRRFCNEVREVHAYIVAGDFSEAVPAPVVVVAPEPTPAPSNEAQHLLSELRRLRKFAAEREVDHISYRPVKDGARMLAVGIPVRAILHACTLHWEDATRRQAGIASFDPETEFPGGLHGYLDALVKARVLIYLYGPAGMGKSYWAKQLADRCFDGRFGAISCNEQATPAWLVGKETMSGFKSTEFLDIWENSGVFLFDEVAASDANFMMLVNDGLANGVIHNAIDGRSYVRHPDCVVIFADNTLGMGSDDNYIRNQLDFSTLDRCRMGRALVGYNADVEDAIFAAALAS